MAKRFCFIVAFVALVAGCTAPQRAFDPNVDHRPEHNPLHEAVSGYNASEEKVEKLLESGADPNARTSSDGATGRVGGQGYQATIGRGRPMPSPSWGMASTGDHGMLGTGDMGSQGAFPTGFNIHRQVSDT